LAITAFGKRYAVIDIGSNSIRLVVFDAIRRAPLPLFNEKILCGLGRGLHVTGRLDTDGVRQALVNLQRFAELVRAMGIQRIDCVATAAVRDAEDGADFVAEVKRTCQLDVRVLSGTEEAELSALGVLAGLPNADGVVGDLGGGSLELVRIDHGEVLDQVTLPLGPLRLNAVSDGRKGRAREIIDEALAELPWLAGLRGKTLYPVGGSWRTLARVNMAQQDYPLRVIHRYRLRRSEIANVTSLVARQSRESLADLAGVSRRRLDFLPLGALVMSRVLKVLQPEQVEFSAYGLREGLLYSNLSASERAEDPLLSACREIAERMSRFPDYGAELVDWTQPLFSDETAVQARLRHAACLLTDIGWRTHPDYRAEHSFNEVLRNPALQTGHHGRSFLALAVHARYTGRESSDLVRRIERLVDGEDVRRARIVGAAARLAETISGGVPGLIDRFTLQPGKKRDLLKLRYQRRDERLIGEIVVKRFEALARVMDLEPKIEPETR
jgi:exopolyphosphatase/guanosine-5'-triphosphate,3'-diphosphate pyrophosphatase